MRFSWHRFLNTTINLSLALAIASSFFIIQEIRIDGILLPQFFYFFAVIALAGVVSQMILFSTPFNKESIKKIGFYATLLFLILIFFAINASFFAATMGTVTIPYYKDLLRVIFLMIFSIAILLYAAREPSSLYWMMGALLVPLLIAPVIFVRNIDAVRPWFPFDFFAGYTLQAFQHNQSSLGSWLIVPFGILAPFVFVKTRSFKRFLILFLLLVATMALIWWTNSRGTILAALLIIFGSGLFAKWWKEITFPKLLTLFISIPVLGFLILPLQIQNTILIRFYPQFTRDVRQANSLISLSYIAKNILSSQPNFLYAQDRQTFWPEYTHFVATHPLGEFGPVLPFEEKGFVYEGKEHNTLLQVGVWGGWGALIAFIYLLYTVFLDAIRGIRRVPSDTLFLGLLMAFIGVLILALLNSFLQEKTLWFLMAILAAYSFRRPSEIKSSS